MALHFDSRSTIQGDLDRAAFRLYMTDIEFSADDLARVVTRPAYELSKTSMKPGFAQLRAASTHALTEGHDP